MSRVSQRAKLSLDEEQTKQLQQLSQSRKDPLREVQRAQILLSYAANKTITAIKNDVGVSILAALDLNTGHVIGQVHERHRSKEFISLLEELDAYYPQDSVIRIILDNVSSHISKETMQYLATKPNRFIYVHTPKHGSWLNLVETLFSKMARTFLKGIRVKTRDELCERILKGIAEINEAPAVYRWKNFDFANNM